MLLFLIIYRPKQKKLGMLSQNEGTQYMYEHYYHVPNITLKVVKGQKSPKSDFCNYLLPFASFFLQSNTKIVDYLIVDNFEPTNFFIRQTIFEQHKRGIDAITFSS